MRSTEVSHEERIAIINRIRRIRGYPPSVALVMSMWLLDELAAQQLLAEAAMVDSHES
jgi:hypothetical protein